MNKVMLIGRLTKDPELKFTPSGTAVCSLTLAVDRRVKDKDNTADFIPVIVWGKQAESTANYIVKGCKFAVSGRIQVRKYTDKDGFVRYATEVVAEEVTFIDWGNKKADRVPNEGTKDEFLEELYKKESKISNDFIEIDDDDVPF